MIITKDTLRWSGHSPQQIDAFAAEFPDGCEVGPEFARVAVGLGLSIDRVAWHVLPVGARAEYDGATDAARAEYLKAKAAAKLAFNGAKVDALLAAGGRH